MWHVSSRSGVETLQTAIHLLLTYLLKHLRGAKITGNDTDYIQRHSNYSSNYFYTKLRDYYILRRMAAQSYI